MPRFWLIRSGCGAREAVVEVLAEPVAEAAGALDAVSAAEVIPSG